VIGFEVVHVSFFDVVDVFFVREMLRETGPFSFTFFSLGSFGGCE
jgi:hypothetical protein